MLMAKSQLPEKLRSVAPYLLTRAGLKITETVDGVLRPLEINQRQFQLLWMLENLSPLSQNMLAELLGVGRGTMVQVVDSLEGPLHYVERVKNPENRRENFIKITEKGRVLLEEAVTTVRAQHKKLFAVLTDDDKTRLCDLLLKLLEET
jgi:MarR family transcriptional regulator for hemolysin